MSYSGNLVCRVGKINVKERRSTWLHSWPERIRLPRITLLPAVNYTNFAGKDLMRQDTSPFRFAMVSDIENYIPFYLLGCLYLDLLNRLRMLSEL